MLYPSNLEDKIGFDYIKDQVSQLCISELGQNRVAKMKFSGSADHVKLWLLQTWEFVEIFNRGDEFPAYNYFDLTPYGVKASVLGAYLSGEEFLKIKQSLQTVTNCVRYLNSNKLDCPNLFELTKRIQLQPELIRIIEQKINKEGLVKDDASDALWEIRKTLKSAYSSLRKNLDSIFKKTQKDGYVPEGNSIAVRDGRLVIPVSSEHKRRVKGFIHDQSASGNIVFIEPAEVLEGNNKIKELEIQEKREVIKILTLLTDQVRPFIEDFNSTSFFLSILDFIRAKALFAKRLDCVLPEFKPEPNLQWNQARHPILFELHKKLEKPVIPLDILLEEKDRILLISGPNAGGKSVCLKTVGLLQYMFQCGLLVPVREDSVFGVFKDLFIDIGDEQSIENDLSTYSSHLNNMKHFTKYSGKETLFLIDEFGTGTDPQFGGAIAEAVLENLLKELSFGIVTTHYSNLKHFADANAGIVNGAMRYNVEQMEPLYLLEIGKPGSSFALEIARKIGLNHHIINKAKSLAGYEHTDVDKILLKLEREKNKSLETSKRLKQKENQLKQSVEKYDKLLVALEGDKKMIINKAKEEAQRLLSDTNKTIEQTIRTIKESKADKQKTKKARGAVEQLKKKNKPELIGRAEYETVAAKPVPGDRVIVLDSKVVGTLQSVKGKDGEIQVGDLITKVKLKRVAKLADQQLKKSKNSNPLSKGINLSDRRASFSTVLDVRGQRAEAILPLLQTYLDDALMFGFEEIKILHGKGNGILRSVVRNFLKGEPYVKKVENEHVERGGDGITVVEIG